MSVAEQHLGLLNRLVDSLDVRISLAAFEGWLAPLTAQVVGPGPWLLDHLLRGVEGSPRDRSRGVPVELGLAECTSGHRCEGSFGSSSPPWLGTACSSSPSTAYGRRPCRLPTRPAA